MEACRIESGIFHTFDSRIRTHTNIFDYFYGALAKSNGVKRIIPDMRDPMKHLVVM